MEFAIGIVITGIGALMIYRAFATRRAVAATKNWPSAVGRILSSSYEEQVSRDVDGDLDTTYETHVEYAYDVNGTAYRGTRVDLGSPSLSSKRRAEDRIARYTPEAPVTVFYDPADPESAVLEQSAGGGNWVSMGIGVFFVCFGLTFLMI